MKIYYDTEFVEDGLTIDLISIGLVAEDGREYYAVCNDSWAVQRAVEHPWLSVNVVPHLPVKVGEVPGGMRIVTRRDGRWVGFDSRWDWDPDHPDFVSVKPRAQIAAEVQRFILATPDPQLWVWYAAYDHVALCQLWGRMIDLPPEVPMFTCDLKQECVRLGNPRVPVQVSGAHNALADARHNRVIDRFLFNVDFCPADHHYEWEE